MPASAIVGNQQRSIVDSQDLRPLGQSWWLPVSRFDRSDLFKEIEFPVEIKVDS
jgi:hypothetical protein